MKAPLRESELTLHPSEEPTAAGHAGAAHFVAEIRHFRRKQRVRVLALLLLTALLAVLATLAISEATRQQPAGDLDVVEVQIAEATIQTISRSVNLSARGSWERSSFSPSQRSGTVTEVFVQSTEQIDEGSPLFSVDLAITYAAEGALPSFRDLAFGDEGEDVRQLQVFLTSLGYYDLAQDGEFGASTRSAVRAWQRSVGIEETGVVARGDLHYFEELPARVAVSDDLRPGLPLAVGDPTLVPLANEPRFWIPLTSDQLRLVPDGARVEVRIGSEIWAAVAGEIVSAGDESASFDVELSGPPLCGVSTCSLELDADRETVLAATVIQVEPVSGIVIPASALRSSDDGSLSVLLEDHSLSDVTVVAEASGLVVVSGIDEGQRVVIG